MIVHNDSSMGAVMDLGSRSADGTSVSSMNRNHGMSMFGLHESMVGAMNCCSLGSLLPTLNACTGHDCANVCTCYRSRSPLPCMLVALQTCLRRPSCYTMSVHLEPCPYLPSQLLHKRFNGIAILHPHLHSGKCCEQSEHERPTHAWGGKMGCATLPCKHAGAQLLCHSDKRTGTRTPHAV